MKNLKILIVTNDEKTSQLAAMMVAGHLSTLKIGANFCYAKSFNEVLKNQIISNYDLVCVFADVFSITVYEVVDEILYGSESNKFLLLSVCNCSIESAKNEDYAQLAFLLNEAGPITDKVKELLRVALKGSGSCKVNPPAIIDPVCIFSHIFFYSKLDSFARRKCELIRDILDRNSVNYYLTDPGLYKEVEIRGARLWIFIEKKDLRFVKDLAKKSKLVFWQNCSELS